jgi:hypothetical protein
MHHSSTIDSQLSRRRLHQQHTTTACPACAYSGSAHWRCQPLAPRRTLTHPPSSCSQLQSTPCSIDTPGNDILTWCRLLTPSSNIQSADVLTTDIALTLSSCPSDYYVLISQPGVTKQSFIDSRKHAPYLASALSKTQGSGSSVRSSLTVSDVHGSVDADELAEVLKMQCGVSITSLTASKGSGIPTAELRTTPHLIKLSLPSPAWSDDVASANDAYLQTLIEWLPKQNYTVLYTTSRSASMELQTEETAEYDMPSQIQETLHMDLKRDLGLHARAKEGNQTIVNGPLFDKYQFFTPGSFTILQRGRACSDKFFQVCGWVS